MLMPKATEDDQQQSKVDNNRSDLPKSGTGTSIGGLVKSLNVCFDV